MVTGTLIFTPVALALTHRSSLPSLPEKEPGKFAACHEAVGNITFHTGVEVTKVPCAGCSILFMDLQLLSGLYTASKATSSTFTSVMFGPETEIFSCIFKIS